MYEVAVHTYGRPIIKSGPAAGVAGFVEHKWTSINARPVGLKRAIEIADQEATHAVVTEWGSSKPVYDNGKPPLLPEGWLPAFDPRSADRLENPVMAFPPVVYSPRLPHEAAWFDGTVKWQGRLYESDVGWMMVGQKVFVPGRSALLLWTYMHEWGHKVAGAMNRSGMVWTLVDAGAFGQHDPLTGLLWEASSPTPDEAIADIYAYLVLEPEFVQERWPDAARAVEEVAVGLGMPLELDDGAREAIIQTVERSRSTPYCPVLVE